jgi:hypothetical protein
MLLSSTLHLLRTEQVIPLLLAPGLRLSPLSLPGGIGWCTSHQGIKV